MKYKILISVSKALLLARWKQTLIAAIGVTFSITMFITLLGFMGGLNDMLDGLIVNRTPHIHMYNEIEPTIYQPIQRHTNYKNTANFVYSIKPKKDLATIYNARAIINTLKKDKRVLGVAPKLTAQVFLSIGNVDLSGIINGVDVDNEIKLFLFKDYVVEGSAENLKNMSNSIIIGKGLADKLMAKVGNVIPVTTSKGDRIQLKVVGIFQSGMLEIDKVQSYTSIETAQKLLGRNSSYITDIQIKLKDINLAPQIAQEYSSIFETHAIDIQTANSQFETGSSIRTLISYAVGITLLIVSGFGIYNILNMLIYEKMDSIAILKATGFSGTDVQLIFLTIALTIGVFGGLLGLIFGFGLSSVIDQIPFNTSALPTIKTFPVNYNPKFYIIGGVFSIITTYLAGYFPSKKASKIDPVIIIRGK
jgi:lipoprotein-releasing system permease protein